MAFATMMKVIMPMINSSLQQLDTNACECTVGESDLFLIHYKPHESRDQSKWITSCW